MYGLLAGILWAMDTVILSYAMSSIPSLSFFIPLIITCFHDLISFIFLMIMLIIRKEFKDFIVCLYHKSSFYIILGALLGGPIGMGCYVLSIHYLSASLSASISAFYPAVGAFFAWLLLKEKMSFIQIIGLFLSIIGVVLLGFTPGKLSFDIGFIFALLCTLGWGLEAVVVGYGLKNNTIKDQYALTIRQGISAMIYLMIIIPILFYNPITIHSHVIGVIGCSALFGTLSYLCYYHSIQKIGAFLSMSLNITYSAFAIILTSILTMTLPDIKTVICTLFILTGSILVYVKRTS